MEAFYGAQHKPVVHQLCLFSQHRIIHLENVLISGLDNN